jgi:hypothetical protein
LRARILVTALAAIPLLAFAQTAGKKEWMAHVANGMPAAFCAPQAYFRQCFSVTAQECESAAATATRNCLDKHGADIPGTLAMPRDGQHWGGVVGKCAGTGTEMAMVKKRISNAKCNDPRQWQ